MEREGRGVEWEGKEEEEEEGRGKLVVEKEVNGEGEKGGRVTSFRAV